VPRASVDLLDPCCLAHRLSTRGEETYRAGEHEEGAPRAARHKLLRSIDGPTVPANTKRALLRCNRVCGVLRSSIDRLATELAERGTVE